MANNKRPRSANFQKDECELLCSLVEKHKNIIENKMSDSTTWKMKEEAWKKIATEFNARCGLAGYRCSKVLKNKYETLKRNTRKKSARIRQELYKTGGGPNNAPTLDPVEEKIKTMILVSVDGLESKFDSDILPGAVEVHSPVIVETIDSTAEVAIIAEEHAPSTEQAQTSTSHYDFVLGQQDMPIIIVPQEEDLQSEPDLVHQPYPESDGTPKPIKWDTLSRKNLKTKKHHAFKGIKKQTIMDRSLDARLELINLQKELVHEERRAVQMKLLWEEEEHKKRMEILNLELEIKKNLNKTNLNI